jgi:hypothetical protein
MSGICRIGYITEGIYASKPGCPTCVERLSRLLANNFLEDGGLADYEKPKTGSKRFKKRLVLLGLVPT